MSAPRRYPRPSGFLNIAVPPLILILGLAGCAAAAKRIGSGRAASTSSAVTAATATTATTEVTSTTATTSTTSPTTTSASPAFAWSESDVSATQLGATWHAGCPVSPDQLRQLSLSFWGFDDRSHTGTMVVNQTVVDAVVRVFTTLYSARFPLQEMIPESYYGGNDNSAAAADDTSGFNCRDAVAPGPPQWSVHAYGEAIDINDVQNPYVDGSTVIPPSGAAYENRDDVRPGMAEPGGVLVSAFASVSWQWGGRWTSSPDYQHFSSTGG